MARFRIGVEQLGAEGLRVEIDTAAGLTDVIELAPGGGIRGRYEQDDTSIGLRSIRADSLVVAELAWSWSSGRALGSLRLRDVEIEATIAIGDNPEGRPGFVGSIRAGAVDGRLQLELGRDTWTVEGLDLHHFELTASESGALTLRIGSATVDTVKGVLGPGDSTTADASELELPDGLAYEAGHLRVGKVTATSLHVHRTKDGAPAAPTWSAEPPSPSPEGIPDGSASSPGARPTPAPGDLPLDGLHGRIVANLRTEFTAPVIGRRTSNHEIDLVIEDGIIDYRGLENGLSMLEDMVIDFELEDDALILEKDIPLVPFDNQTLLRWPLDRAGVALAKKGKIRLATLLRPRGPNEPDGPASEPEPSASAAPAESRPAAPVPAASPAPEPDEPEPKGPVDLHRVDVQGIDVELGVAGPFALAAAGGFIRSAGSEQPLARWLRLQGHLAHVPDQAPPGALVLGARDLSLALDGLRLGPRRLDVGTVAIDEIEGAGLSLFGLSPGSLDARLRGLVIRSLALGPDRA